MTSSPPADFTWVVGPGARTPGRGGDQLRRDTRTWAELVERVRGAAALRAAGIGPGDRVAVLDLNHPSCVELTLACAQVGAANAVVTSGWPRRRSST